jgi:hypothetical protein
MLVFMFRFLLAAGLLLPQLRFAQLFGDGAFQEGSFAEQFDSGQFNRFAVGSYVLRNQPSVRHYGQLKLRNGRKLVVKTIAGKTRRIKARKALSYSIGQHRYSVINQLQFYIGSHLDLVSEKAAYAQVLDSGKVVLLRYDHLFNTGIDWLFLYRYPTSVYLVRDQPDSAFAAIGDTFDKVYFQQHVRQFLVTRADLVNMLDAGLITYQNFPSAIHALNQNLPFCPLAVPKSKKQ